MLRDWCTWDDDYEELVQDVRSKLVRLATPNDDKYTAVLMQGSGTFAVEAMVGSTVPEKGKLLVLTNGAYGDRIVQMTNVLKIQTVVHDSGERHPPDLARLKDAQLRCTVDMSNEKIGAKIAKAHGEIEIIVALDGYWPTAEFMPPHDDRLRYVHWGSAGGMRRGIDAAAAISTGGLSCRNLSRDME